MLGLISLMKVGIYTKDNLKTASNTVLGSFFTGTEHFMRDNSKITNTTEKVC